MARGDPLRNLLHWLAGRLPSRQEVREEEWLAELETLPSYAQKLQFVLSCTLATWRMQPQPLLAGLTWSLAALKGVGRWARGKLWVSEGEMTAYERTMNRTFTAVKRDYVTGSYAEFLAQEERLPAEVELPPLNFRVLDQEEAPDDPQL